MRNTPLVIGACLLFVPLAAAQGRGVGALYTANLPGDALLPPGSANIGININVGSGQNPNNPFVRQSGVTRLPNGHYIISSEAAIGTSSAHKFFELASDGTYLAQYDQPNFTIVDSRGLRDLGWDRLTGPDSRIWSGTDGSGITSFDWHTNTFDPMVGFGPAGFKVLGGYVGNAVWCCTVADFGTDKVLVTADSPTPNLISGFAGRPTNWHLIQTPAVGVSPGSEFTTFAKFREPTADPSEGDNDPRLGFGNDGKFGVAFDPVHKTLWYALDAAASNPNPNKNTIRFQEMDLDGNGTGQIFQGDRAIVELDTQGILTWGVARGVQFYVDTNGELVVAYIAAFANEVLVEMHAGFDFGTGCGGDIGWENEPFVGNRDTFNITLQNAPSNPLNTAFLFRSMPVAEPGLTLPGITNCGFLLSLVGLRGLGGLPLVNGGASFHQDLPNIPSLAGVEIGYQWLLPSGPGALPLNASAAGVVRIGENM